MWIELDEEVWPARKSLTVFIWAPSAADRTTRYERDPRDRIERRYARQGITAVPYNLQRL